jgi:ATP-dependent exoDNAse (exonuclease V) alpha subunit
MIHPKKNWIPINPFSAYSKVLNSSRKQIPIRLAYAMTIHKSQGQTLDMAVIDLGSKETQLGLTYVALSK